MRALWILFSALLSAALVPVLYLSLEALRPVSNGQGTEELTSLMAHDVQATRTLLSVLCERDLTLDRVLLELSSGSAPRDLSRESAALSRLLGGEARLFVEQAGQLRDASGRAPLAITRAALDAAAQERVALDADPPVLLDSCARTRDRSTVWVVRSIMLSSLAERAHVPASALELTHAARAEPALVHFTRFPVRDTLYVTQTRERRLPDALPTLIWLSGAMLGVGALWGALATRAQSTDEHVLSTLEAAAARVAQGDLSSQIALRVGGRADQTFRSFDRMTAELRDMRAKLAEAEHAAAWQDMARRIAHEIKNPLSPIRIALETLRKAHHKRLASFDEIFEESTRAMLEEVARMEHIVREFSEFARLPKARPGALDLVRLAHDTTALYAPDAPDAVDVQVLGVDQLELHADREQLVQVVVNLLTNAVQAAQQSATPQVRISIEHDGAQAALHVDDNGQGVPEAERERIFEPYVTGREQGTGLGLSIVKRIVLDHAGSVEVSRGPLGGARFSVRLPLPDRNRAS